MSKAYREIIYPIFLQCVPLTDDLFWREIFEELAYGNAPTGTYISKGFFCSKEKSKEFTYKFIDSEPEKIFENIVKLLKKNNIMSNNDRKILTDEFIELSKKIHQLRYTEWNNIKKKSLKDLLIQNFLIQCKKEYNLSDSQIKKAYKFINLGLILKKLNNDDFSYVDGNIIEISDVTFSPGKVSLNFDKYDE